MHHATVASSGRIWNISSRRCIIQPRGVGKRCPRGFPRQGCVCVCGHARRSITILQIHGFESHRPHCGVDASLEFAPHRHGISRRCRRHCRRISSFPPFDESSVANERTQDARKKGDQVKRVNQAMGGASSVLPSPPPR